MINSLVDRIHQFQDQAAAVIEDIHITIEYVGDEVIKAIHSELKGEIDPKLVEVSWIPGGKLRSTSSTTTGASTTISTSMEEGRLPDWRRVLVPEVNSWAIISLMRSAGTEAGEEGPEYGGKDGVPIAELRVAGSEDQRLLEGLLHNKLRGSQQQNRSISFKGLPEKKKETLPPMETRRRLSQQGRGDPEKGRRQQRGKELGINDERK
ncbi:hypothetical protein PPACK8108_LOCUS11267 [Phakopsora pachyrhizi]|uniref:Uncharacterized protein n=1 Tax=Phakopsora pachyrhizi TaxID=170000 RepID=A0AAV0B4V1_PHAPC|nr:hypothetical protein PPACK8108_LOCUS11267 [Phakopsora pachyrhizi]